MLESDHRKRFTNIPKEFNNIRMLESDHRKRFTNIPKEFNNIKNNYPKK